MKFCPTKLYGTKKVFYEIWDGAKWCGTLLPISQQWLHTIQMSPSVRRPTHYLDLSMVTRLWPIVHDWTAQHNICLPCVCQLKGQYRVLEHLQPRLRNGPPILSFQGRLRNIGGPNFGLNSSCNSYPASYLCKKTHKHTPRVAGFLSRGCPQFSLLDSQQLFFSRNFSLPQLSFSRSFT